MDTSLIDAWCAVAASYQHLCRDARTAAAYRELRYRYTYELSRLFADGQDWGLVVYGVWLRGHPHPVYIGQTTQAKRRLWDLPIGESHHLGFTFPPEIWERVVVMDWQKVVHENLHRGAAFAGEVAERAIGLALEHRLQRDANPLFNSRKKRNNGKWRDVDFTRSNGVAAQAARDLDKFYPTVKREWDELASIPIDNHSPVRGTNGRYAFFPQTVLMRVLRGLRADEP
ncbi:MAG TPA: hypothetical protein VFJ16_24580 [Longimicrobium sp.]|nr:hypothetical protein [Longimicrobium sp.]